MSSNQLDPIFKINADGSVAVQGNDFTETIRPWGHPLGFGVDGCQRETYNGQAQPLFLLSAMRHAGRPTCRSGESIPVSAQPIQQIAESVPTEVLKAIFAIPHWPIELVQIAECNPEIFVLMARTNPGLLCFLAREVANSPLIPVKQYGQLLGQRENQICRALGLTSDAAWYLRKIFDVGLLAHGYLDLAITAWNRPGMGRLLRHVPRVTLDLMLTCINHYEIAAKCPSLLHIASDASSPRSDYSTDVYQLVETISQLRRNLRQPTWPWRVIRDIGHLQKIRGRTEQAAMQAGVLEEACYPPPPVSPCSDWRWVSTSSELTEVGERYDNCAEMYHWRCLVGDCAIYVSRRTGYEDTVIVTLTRDHSFGKWQVSDIVGPDNALVDENEQRQVREHFEGGAQ